MSTICAISTAQGGAIGIVRTSGSDAIRITQEIFRSRQSLLHAEPNTVHFGRIMDGDDIVDEVLVTIFRAPHSYTGEDSTEISCHGSSYILQRIVELLLKHGCQMAAPGEYTQRAFLNGKLDLTQAEAVADLIASRNAAQHHVAMQQLRGGVTTKLKELRDKLLHLTSLLELELDFSDHEELEFADRSQLNILGTEIINHLQHLSASFTQGNAIKSGIPVAIIGAPNVGKSTLLNQLLQDEKAIVSDIQGTTRDLIEDTFNINGILFRFIDTAGIRQTDDTIEKLGIERSLQAAAKADIILMMRDTENDFPAIDTRQDQLVIRIFNKSESFQAINGKGLDELKSQLLRYANDKQNVNDVLISSLRHKEAIDLAIQDLLRALAALNQSYPTDLVSEDLRLCINHLSDITGSSITPNDVLSNIFQHFCIGK